MMRKTRNARRLCMARRLGTAASVVLVCGAASSALAQPEKFSALTSNGFFFAVPRAISADGSVIAGDFSTQFGQAQAGRWVFPGPSSAQIGFISGQGTSVEILTRDGQTIYGRSTFTAFRWTSPGPIVADPNGTTTDITPDGAVRIVSNQRQVGAGAVENLGAPGGYDDGFLRSMSASGAVILGTGRRVESGGGYRGRGGDQVFSEAALWNVGAGWQPLGFLPGDGFSEGLFLSDDGAVQVGTSRFDEGSAARTWRRVGAGPLTDLGTLPGFEGASVVPIDMSADGSVIVGEISSRLFVWTVGVGMEDLEDKLRAQLQDLDQWQLLSVDALSADGNYVVGQGLNPGGDVASWIAPLSYSCAPLAGPRAQGHQVIATVGDIRASEPGAPTVVTVSDTTIPAVAPGGQVLHSMRLSNGVRAIFDQSGPSLVSTGQIAPSGSPFAGFTTTIPSANGFLVGGSVGSGTTFNQGLWVGGMGTPAQLAVVGHPIAQGGSVVQGFFGTPRHNNAGQTAFIADFGSAFNFRVGVPGSTQVYGISAATAAPFPPDVIFTTPALTALNSAGQIALTEEIIYSGVADSQNSCIMVRSAGQTTDQIRVLEGAQAPGVEPGVSIGDVLFADVSMNASGRLAFVNTLSTGESAVLADGDSGLVVVARDGMQAPGQAPGVTLRNFDVALINDNNTVLIRAIMQGPGIEATRSVWAGPVSGPLTLLLGPGQELPGLSFCRTVFDVERPIVLNNADQVLIPVTMQAGGNTVVLRALYVHDPEQGLALVAADNEPFSFGPGDDRVLANVRSAGPVEGSTSEGGATSMNDQGVVTFFASVNGGPTSLLKATVTPPAPPACPGDADGSGRVDFDDLTTVLANFGSLVGPFGSGDADGTGMVNFDDLTTVLANFGNTCP